MPTSVGIAAFVVGLGLLVAAIVGRSVKLVSLEMPDLTRVQRVTVGALGAGLTIFGLSEARGDRARATPVAIADVTTTEPTPALRGSPTGSAPTGPAPTGASVTGSPAPAPGDPTLACLAAVPSADIFTLDVERGRRTDRKPQAAMPRDAQIALLPRVDGRPLGAIVYATRSTGGSFRIAAVYDATCTPVSTYRNVSNPDAARDAVGTYETVEFRLGSTTVGIMLAYGEGEPVLLMTGQIV